MTSCRPRLTDVFTVCARGAIGLLLLCLPLVPLRAQSGRTANSPTAIKVVTIDVRPFEGDDKSNPVLKDARSGLETALFSALGRARDMELSFSSTETLNDVMASNSDRQKYAHVIKGPINRSIKATPPDYLIKTSYITYSANQVWFTSQIVVEDGGTVVGGGSALGDLKSTDPFGALGKKLMSDLRRIVHLEQIARPIIYVPCFQIIGDIAAADALRDKLQVYREFADQGLTEHASVKTIDCAPHADLHPANAPQLYVKGTIFIRSTVYKETNQRIVEYLLILSICRGQNLEEELRKLPAGAPCDEEKLMKVAQDLGEKIGRLLEDGNFLESN